MDVVDVAAWVIVPVLAVVVVIVLFQDRLEPWRIRRQHRRMPSTPIAALRDHQLGRIVGSITASEQTLTAPLSGRPCVYYRVVISVYNRGWQARATDRCGTRFAMSDRSATAIIEPFYSRLALRSDHREELGWFTEATPEQQAVLARHGFRRSGVFARRWFRFDEAVIATGDPIGVIGAGVREPELPGPASEDRTAAPVRLRITGSVKAPLSILCGMQP
jgi:hypothetical protein